MKLHKLTTEYRIFLCTLYVISLLNHNLNYLPIKLYKLYVRVYKTVTSGKRKTAYVLRGSNKLELINVGVVVIRRYSHIMGPGVA